MTQFMATTSRTRQPVLDYQPQVVVGTEAPSDGVWLTGQVIVHGVLLPGPNNYTAGQRLAEPPLSRFVWPGIVAWLICLGLAVGLVVATLLAR